MENIFSPHQLMRAAVQGEKRNMKYDHGLRRIDDSVSRHGNIDDNEESDNKQCSEMIGIRNVGCSTSSSSSDQDICGHSLLRSRKQYESQQKASKDDHNESYLYTAPSDGRILRDSELNKMQQGDNKSVTIPARSVLSNYFDYKDELLRRFKMAAVNVTTTTEEDLIERPLELLKIETLNDVKDELFRPLKLTDHLVLAHSAGPIRTVKKLIDAFFEKELYDQMVRLGKTKVLRIQSYAWPHLLRKSSLIVINPLQSGKTWCYIPPVSSMLIYRSVRIPDTYGPIAIILVATLKHVEHISDLFRKLLNYSQSKVIIVSSYGLRNFKETKIHLLKSCGILICTPNNLLRLLESNKQERLINPDRLQHLVIDDFDLMMSRSPNEMVAALRDLFKMCRQPKTDKLSVQLVVTSRVWDSYMVGLLRHSNQPLLCIGDFLEAAIYGKAIISIKLHSSKQKISAILQFIKEHPINNESLIILCNSDDDVLNVTESLMRANCPCIGYCGQSRAIDRVDVNEWNRKLFCSHVFVSSDDAFAELQIQTAYNLIHYSMPATWTLFTRRFAAIAKTLTNFVVNGFANNETIKQREKPAHSLILLDENNRTQLPRLIDFLRKHKQEKYLNPNILALSHNILIENEMARDAKCVPLCPSLLEFGDCDVQQCVYRHTLTPNDANDKSKDIPTSGDLRVHILKVFSPTYYAVRLLEHRSVKSTKWREIRSSSKAALFRIELNMYCQNDANLTVHWPLAINDICIYKARNENTFQRARILEIPDIKLSTNILQNVYVKIKLIDDGTMLENVRSDSLFLCDGKFRQFPAQAVDIRLMGVIPFDNERTWESNTTETVHQWIVADIKATDRVHVSIEFALSKTIWVNNVVVVEELTGLGTFMYRTIVKRALIGKKFGMRSPNDQKSIRQMAEEQMLLAPRSDEVLDDECSTDNDQPSSDCNATVQLKDVVSVDEEEDVLNDDSEENWTEDVQLEKMAISSSNQNIDIKDQTEGTIINCPVNLEEFARCFAMSCKLDFDDKSV